MTLHTTTTRARDERRTLQADWMRFLSTLETDRVLDELNSTRWGLTAEAVDLAREVYGANEVARTPRDPAWKRLLLSFVDPFNGILAVLAAVSLCTDVIWAAPGQRDLSTTLIILAMVMISGLLRFVQEGRSGDAAEALAKTIQTTCCVERADTGRIEVPLTEVVVGDVVHLSVGDIIPADARLIASRDLFLGLSSLTGESVPQERTARACPEAEDDRGMAVADLPNMVLMGSTVVSGTGSAVVVAVGANTMFGGIAQGLGAQGRAATAYDQGIRSVSMLLLRLMAIMAPVVLVVNGLTKGDWLAALLFALSVAVGLTPEMLPMIVTTCLAKGAVDLSHDRVIVKRLDAVQNLGAMDVLCSDKTGTLTEDHVILERHLDVTGKPDTRVLRYAFLNSYYETGMRNLIDSAIIERAGQESADPANDLDIDALTDRWQLVDEVPFDFERRRVSVVIGDEDGNTLMITKGAIEELLDVCSQVEYGDEVVDLTGEMREMVMARAARLADKGMRVLGVARIKDPAGVDVLSREDEHGMTLIGYLAFLDPPKESAATAVRALADHGVAVKVLTGDSLRVAVNVCETIGIPCTGTLDGTALEQLDDDELAACVDEVSVFAKLSPDQKVRVVRALRERGHVVGFMGDGVNDAGAMHAADCGVSVDSGADVAKEAADVILLEKDLGVLERGVVTGRRTFVNMNKYVKMTASSNFGNIFSVLVASALLPFLPMTAVQLLFLNLVYDIACTLVPWDSVDEDALLRPRAWEPGAISGFMRWIGPTSSVFDIVTYVLLFFVICPAAAGGTWGELAGDAAARDIFAATFQAGWFVESMVTQVLFVHLVRTERLPLLQSRADWRLTLTGAVAVAVALVVPFTGMGEALGFAPLPASFFGWLVIVVTGYVALVMLVRRIYQRKYGSLI